MDQDPFEYQLRAMQAAAKLQEVLRQRPLPGGEAAHAARVARAASDTIVKVNAWKVTALAAASTTTP